MAEPLLLKRSRIAVRRSNGLTAIELLIAVAIGGILVAIAVPSMRDWMINQRIVGATSEVVNTLNYARSESLQRASDVLVRFGVVAGSFTCYTTYDSPDLLRRCDCTLGAGTACPGPAPGFPVGLAELRTVTVESSTGVSVKTTGPTIVKYGRLSGLAPAGSTLKVTVKGSNGNSLNVGISPTGRPQVCLPSGSKISGYEPC